MKIILPIILILALSGCYNIAAKESLKRAEKDYNKGEYEKTLSKINEAEIYAAKAENGSKERIALLKARTYESIGDIASAEAIYEYILKNFPDTQEGLIANKKLAFIRQHIEVENK